MNPNKKFDMEHIQNAILAGGVAIVAFWMYSMTNFLLGFIHADNANVVTTQAHKLKLKLKYQYRKIKV